ncbi:hypothetical protein Ddye_019999 [Dipteronia dyeriana]|uniref:Transmembrane protein n=1 Tax=Dipteronia dyeriana TaxID=168575 RepID=A0AAD9WUY8_9ROSI|nr:hypothetical protein Ddye_019999 [Dipteronia dyeriana]
MISSTRIAIMIASLALLIAITTVKSTTARELRPSYHGLEYQSPPPSSEQTPQEVKSFFKGSMSPPTPENVALPRAMNSTDRTPWWSSGHEGRDRARRVMLVASLVCGATGVTLLVASAFIYFFRYRTRKSQSSFVHNGTNNTK